MSDPQPERLKPRPRRAAPIQPDQPGSGNAKESDPEAPDESLDRAAAEKQKEQSQTALDNVSKGYG